MRSSLIILTLVFVLPSCGPVPSFMTRTIERWSEPIVPVPGRLDGPVFDQNGMTIHWVGHATMVIQVEDKVIVTDPNFTRTIGIVARRMVETGIDPARIPRADAVLISHLHFDHMSFGSLDLLPKQGTLLFPDGGAEYIPELGYAGMKEMKWWETFEDDGLRITAVPVQHFGGRFGFDIAWMQDRGYTGYIIEYRGRTVFFGGDMGYNASLYKSIGERFPIDVAILPIAPVEPRDFMARVHVDPAEALRVMDELGARVMIPMHHSTFYQGLEPSLTYAVTQLDSMVTSRGLQDRVKILGFGERWASPPVASPSGSR